MSFSGEGTFGEEGVSGSSTGTYLTMKGKQSMSLPQALAVGRDLLPAFEQTALYCAFPKYGS